MARIEGVDLPRNKRVEVGLTYLYGIGPTRAREILSNTKVNPDIRVKDLSEADVAAIRDRQIPIWYFAFGALHHFDLPQFMSCLSGVRGFVVNPIDGDWNPLSQDAAERINAK